MSQSGSSAAVGLVLLFSLAWSAPVVAEEAPDLEAEARRAQARAHLAMGRQALAQGDHVEALDQLQQSFELSPDPELRFDLGRCHLELGQRDEARQQLELYLAEVDPGLITQERRQEVEAMLARTTEEPPPQVEPQPEPEPRDPDRH
jgi:tetratricopeptide (TPR) repeat protein